jgi:hypothetical protein
MPDLAPGMVAVHNDEFGQHHAVILEIEGAECKALFFTSNSHWGAMSRRATKDELAMAGFVYSRTTYLTYVTRSVWDFHVTDLSFPKHWIQSLRQEFVQGKPLVRTRTNA